MKKWIAWLLCLCMLAGCLAGCDKEPEEEAPSLIGTWNVILDGTDLLNQALDAQLGELGQHIQLRNLFIPLKMTFDEEGTVHIATDPRDIQAFAAAAQQQIRLGYRAYALAAMAAQGLDMSLEELEAEQRFQLDELLDLTLSQEFLRSLATGLTQGSMVYTAGDTTLYLGENRSAFTYTMDGNDLILEPGDSAGQAEALAAELVSLAPQFQERVGSHRLYQTITGTWQAEVDVSGYLHSLLSSTYAEAAPYVSLHDLKLVFVIAISPEGTLGISLDPASAHMLIGDLHSQIGEALLAYTQSLIDGTGAAVSATDYLRSQGTNAYLLAEQSYPRAQMLTILNTLCLESSCYLQGDQLCLSVEGGPEVTVAFSTEGGQLELLSADSAAADIFTFFPLSCTEYIRRDPAALVGTWQSSLDFTNAINAKISEADPTIGQYLVLTDMTVDVSITLAADGSFTTSYSQESINALVAKLEQQMIPAMDSYLRAQLAANGQDITLEEALASQNTTLEALVHESLNPEELANSLISTSQGSGSYTANDYQLTFTYGTETSLSYYVRDNILYLFPESSSSLSEYTEQAPFALSKVG